MPSSSLVGDAPSPPGSTGIPLQNALDTIVSVNALLIVREVRLC